MFLKPSWRNGLGMVCFLCAFFSFTVQAQEDLPPSDFFKGGNNVTTRPGLIQTPVSNKGLNLDQISSCQVIEQIPWVFRKTNRQSRFIAKDKLRLSTQSDFAYWSIYQVLDERGYVSYVFRRPLPGGRFESIVTKESYYNRIIDSSGTRRIVDARDLRNLIDRPALVFFAESGNRVEYMPGFAGRETLIIYYTRQTAPVYLRNKGCKRGNAEGVNPFDKDATASGGEEGGDSSSGGGGEQ